MKSVFDFGDMAANIAEFTRRNGRIAFIPNIAELVATGLKVHVRDEDVCVPVCPDGLARSQILYLVLHSIKRGLDEPRVVVPHGSESGYDPYQAFQHLNSRNVFGYLLDAVPPAGTPDAWVSSNFLAVFGVQRTRRLGEQTAVIAGRELNPSFSFAGPMFHRLSRHRTEQRRAMNSILYDVGELYNLCGEGGRVVVFACGRSAAVFLARLLEVSSDHDLSRVVIVVLPAESSLYRVGTTDCAQHFERTGVQLDRDGLHTFRLKEMYAMYASLLHPVCVTPRSYDWKKGFDLFQHLKRVELELGSMRTLCPGLDFSGLLLSSPGIAKQFVSTPYVTASSIARPPLLGTPQAVRLPKECVLNPAACHIGPEVYRNPTVAVFAGTYNQLPAVFKTASSLLVDGMHAPDRQSLLGEVTHEAFRLSYLRDLHVEQFYGVVTLPTSTAGDVVWLACEASDGGTLDRPSPALVSILTSSPWDSLWIFARGLFRGLSALHMHQPVVVHGNVCPEACLFFLGSGTFMTKVSTPVHLEGYEVSSSTASSSVRAFRAPELLSDESESPSVPTTASDVYAAGMVMVQFIYSRMHSGRGSKSKLTLEDRDARARDVLACIRETHPKIYNVLRQCISASPTDRGSSRHILQMLEKDTIAVGTGLERSNIVCQYFRRCGRFISSALRVPDDLFVWGTPEAACYCEPCMEARSDGMVYWRGVPSSAYVAPKGWARAGLRVGGTQAKAVGAFDKWHVAYHGTKVDSVCGIMRTGCLAKPGDTVLDGIRIGIRDGHILREFERDNKHTGKRERFNPNQIFLSPVIAYSALSQYAASSEWTDPVDGLVFHARTVFQVRIRPGTYGIGQQTVGATDPVDATGTYSNNSLEWYTTGEERGALLLTGLLVQLTPKPGEAARALDSVEDMASEDEDDALALGDEVDITE